MTVILAVSSRAFRSARRQTSLRLAAPALALAISVGVAKAEDCAREDFLKSSQAGPSVELSLRNASAERRRVYWLDQNGDRKFYGVVEPGNVLKQPTTAGHSWVVTNDAEKCLSIVTATSSATVDIGGTATAQIAPPPPGMQQPIASAPAAPPQVAATETPAAQLSGADAQQMAGADQPPEASPVEQFQLSGAYRFHPRSDSAKALNQSGSGVVNLVQVQPRWDSAKWLFEEVPGTSFVRIVSQWKKTALIDDDGKLRAKATDADADESHWSFEPVDGTPYVQLRNRDTGRFLVAGRGAPELIEDINHDQEAASHWQFASASGSAVAAVSNRAYDSALDSCREIGGIWTGSSCRAVTRERPLTCPRGFAWSDEFGECEWAGGACPPWQAGPGGRCVTDLACRGGAVRSSRRGLSCDCPPGMVTWGNYPRLSCVPSVAAIARVAPLVIGNRGPALFGNRQFGSGQFRQGFGGGRQGGGGSQGQTRQGGGGSPQGVLGQTGTQQNVGGQQQTGTQTNVNPQQGGGQQQQTNVNPQSTGGATQQTNINSYAKSLFNTDAAGNVVNPDTGKPVVISATDASKQYDQGRAQELLKDPNLSTSAKSFLQKVSSGKDVTMTKDELAAGLALYATDPKLTKQNPTAEQVATFVQYKNAMSANQSAQSIQADNLSVGTVSSDFLAKLRKDGANAVATNPAEQRVLDVYSRGVANSLNAGSTGLSTAERQIMNKVAGTGGDAANYVYGPVKTTVDPATGNRTTTSFITDPKTGTMTQTELTYDKSGKMVNQKSNALPVTVLTNSSGGVVQVNPSAGAVPPGMVPGKVETLVNTATGTRTTTSQMYDPKAKTVTTTVLTYDKNGKMVSQMSNVQAGTPPSNAIRTIYGPQVTEIDPATGIKRTTGTYIDPKTGQTLKSTFTFDKSGKLIDSKTDFLQASTTPVGGAGTGRGAVRGATGTGTATTTTTTNPIGTGAGAKGSSSSTTSATVSTKNGALGTTTSNTGGTTTAAPTVPPAIAKQNLTNTNVIQKNGTATTTTTTTANTGGATNKQNLTTTTTTTNTTDPNAGGTGRRGRGKFGGAQSGGSGSQNANLGTGGNTSQTSNSTNTQNQNTFKRGKFGNQGSGTGGSNQSGLSSTSNTQQGGFGQRGKFNRGTGTGGSNQSGLSSTSNTQQGGSGQRGKVNQGTGTGGSNQSGLSSTSNTQQGGFGQRGKVNQGGQSARGCPNGKPPVNGRC